MYQPTLKSKQVRIGSREFSVFTYFISSYKHLILNKRRPLVGAAQFQALIKISVAL